MRLNIFELARNNQAILLLSGATALLTTGQGIAAPILPLYADELGVSFAQIGLVISAFGLARLLTNMPAAILSDRYGRRLILVGGPIIAAVGNILSGTADTLELLLVYRFIAGIGSAAFITGAVIFIGDISTPNNRGRMMSVYQGSFTLGISLGPAMGGLIAEGFGLRAPFYVVGVVSLASGVWAFFRVPETRSKDATGGGRSAKSQAAPTDASGKKERTYGFLLSKDFLLIALVFAGTFFTRGGAQFTLVPLKGSQDLLLSPGQIGALFTIPPLINFVLLPFVGIVSDRFGRKKTIVPGLLVFSVALTVLGFSPTLPLYVLGMVLYGLGQGIEGPTPVAYVADVSPPARQAVAQGTARSLGDAALLIGPPLMGYFADVVSAKAALVSNGVMMAVLGILFLLFAREPVRRRGRRVEEEDRKAE